LNPEYFDFDLFEIPTVKELAISGNNCATLAIITSKADFNNHKELLSKILGAIDLDLEKDVCQILLENAEPILISNLLPKEIQYLLVFGLNPSQIGFNASFKAYHLYSSETYKILLSHSLTKLSENQNFKKSLWASLRNEFKQD